MDRYVLKTEGLIKDFGSFRVVDGVELRVRKGSIHALIGPNGAGKTTLFNLLTRFLAPSGGSIHFENQEITAWSAPQLARAGVIRSFQISATFGTMSALENVRCAIAQRSGSGQWAFWRSDRTLHRHDDEANSYLDMVGLQGDRDVPVQALPYGAKRALELATTMAMRPTLMLLDEPTAGLALEDVDRISVLIRKLAEGRTILMVEHNLKVVRELADTITVLNRGQVIGEGSYADIAASDTVVKAYLGDGDAFVH